MVRTLMMANQNSISPYTRVPPQLMATATTRQTAIQAAGLMSGAQYPIRTAAAESSAGRTIVQSESERSGQLPR